MTDFEKKEYYSSLYDLYSCLLTEKQKSYFEDYYFNDLSLYEIASNNDISRNAVYDQLQKVVSILDSYEDKLGLLKKEKKLNDVLEEYSKCSNSDVLKLIEEIKNME